MKTVNELHGHRPITFYSGEDFELIVFDDYKHGEPAVLLKYKEHDRFNGAFVELYGSSGSSSGTKKTFSLNNVWEQYIQKVNIWLVDDKAFVTRGSLSFEILTKFDRHTFGDTPVLELPHRRVARFFYKFKDSDNYILVDRDELHHALPSKVYLGNNISGYGELEVISDKMYRDGGTTYIKTPKGTLYHPTSFKVDLIPTWTDEGQVVHKLESVDINITNEHKVKMLHEILNVKEENLLKSE